MFSSALVEFISHTGRGIGLLRVQPYSKCGRDRSVSENAGIGHTRALRHDRNFVSWAVWIDDVAAVFAARRSNLRAHAASIAGPGDVAITFR